MNDLRCLDESTVQQSTPKGLFRSGLVLYIQQIDINPHVQIYLDPAGSILRLWAKANRKGLWHDIAITRSRVHCIYDVYRNLIPAKDQERIETAVTNFFNQTK